MLLNRNLSSKYLLLKVAYYHIYTFEKWNVQLRLIKQL